MIFQMAMYIYKSIFTHVFLRIKKFCKIIKCYCVVKKQAIKINDNKKMNTHEYNALNKKMNMSECNALNNLLNIKKNKLFKKNNACDIYNTKKICISNNEEINNYINYLLLIAK